MMKLALGLENREMVGFLSFVSAAICMVFSKIEKITDKVYEVLHIDATVQDDYLEFKLSKKG